MNFCSNCGARVVKKIPQGDDQPRFVCEACHTVHYQNPKMVVGCIPEYGDKVLLCRRAIEPRCGFWTLPAGYLENGETVAEGSAREALEETGAGMDIGDLFAVLTLINVHQVYLMYRAVLLDQDYGPTKESLEVRLFSEEEIPWDEIAFSSIKETLRLYFQDRAKGRFCLHQGTIPPTDRK